MIFKIFFETGCSNQSFNLEKHGFFLVDMARNATNLPELCLDLIAPNIKSFWPSGTSVIVPENIARKSGHFNEKSIIYIHFTPKIFEKFVEVVPIFTMNTMTGAIEKVNFEHKLNDQKFLKYWEKNNFSLNIDD